MKIATKLIAFTRVLMCILLPISWPIAKGLDCCFGHQGKTRFKIKELKSLIELHVGSQANDEGDKNPGDKPQKSDGLHSGQV